MINHLLLIDDDPMVRKVNSFLVQKACLSKRTTSLANGLEGIEFLEKVCLEESDYFPEVILLDIHMPFMSGWDFLDEFTARYADSHPTTKIIMVSASVDPNDILKAYSYHSVISFLQKPLELKELEDLKWDKHLYTYFYNQPDQPSGTDRGNIPNSTASNGAALNKLNNRKDLS